MITLLILDSSILHKDIPEESPEFLTYPDIIYPKNIIAGYILKQFDLPEDFDITLYKYNTSTQTIELKVQPGE